MQKQETIQTLELDKQEDVGSVNKITLFPTLIYKVKLLEKNQIFEIFTFLKGKRDKLKKHGTGPLSTHNLGENILDEIEKLSLCKNIKNNILNVSKKYLDETGILAQNLLGHSWFNVQEKNVDLKPHIHPNCILSGALYINVNENSSPLTVNNPNPFMKTLFKNPKDFSFDLFNLDIMNGELFLFPYYLEHYSNNNKTEDRTVISFNIN